VVDRRPIAIADERPSLAATGTPSRSANSPRPSQPSWLSDAHRSGVSPRLLRQHLADAGFFNLLLGRKRTANAVLVHRDDNVIREVDDRHVRQYLLAEAERERYGAAVLDILCELTKHAIDGVTRLLPMHSYNGQVPGTAPLSVFTDTADEVRFIAATGVVVITANHTAIHPLETLNLGDAAVWESEIHPRAITIEPPDAPRKGRFETFCERAFWGRVRSGSSRWTDDFGMTPEGEAQYRAFRGTLGYLLHRYRDPANPKAVIFVDEASDGTYAQGGTGKSLTLRAVKHVRALSVQDGRRFQNNGTFGGRFQFSNVTADTNIIGIDDAGLGFKFEGLFAMLAGDMEVEQKGKNKIVIPAARAPKVAITTNYVVPDHGTSVTRRRYIVQFGSYWAEAHRQGEQVSDLQHLGKRLFGADFTDQDWNDFFNFLFRCVQQYLREGVVEASTASYGLKGLRVELGSEFVSHFTDYFDGLVGRRHIDPERGEFLDDLLAGFTAAFPGHGCRPVDFPTKLMRLGEFWGWQYNSHKASKGETPTARRWRVTDSRGEKRNAVRWAKTGAPDEAPPSGSDPAGSGGGAEAAGHHGPAAPDSCDTGDTGDTPTVSVTGVTDGNGSDDAMSDGTLAGPAVTSPGPADLSVSADTDDTRDASNAVSGTDDYETDGAPWADSCRPRTIGDCILPARLKGVFAEMVQTRKVPNLLLYGPSGTGKTTVAKAVCAELGIDPLVINASEDRGIDLVRERLRPYAAPSSLYGRKFVILDEADHLTELSQAALRAFTEEVSAGCGFILTANSVDKIIPALLSRCTEKCFGLPDDRVELLPLMIARAERILHDERVTYHPALVAEIVAAVYPDFRKVLNILQGAVVKGILVAVAVTPGGKARYGGDEMLRRSPTR